MNRSVTIQDVAALARTSPSTVSNVLNGRVDRMRPETQARVERAMEQLGYQANQVARQLKTGQSPMIGLVIPSVANPFWGMFAQHVEEAALARGYQVLLGNGGRDPLREQRYAESLWGYGVRGVILGSSPLSLDHIFRLIERGLHVVVFDRQIKHADRAALAAMDSVSIDNVAAGYRATRHLLDLGHRTIGFVSGPLRTSSRLDRLEGYRNALIDAGIKYDPELVWDGGGDRSFGDVEGADIGRTGAQALVGRQNPPTGLVAINDMYALGAYAGIRDLGMRVPENCSVIGFDDIGMAQIACPPLTTVRQPLRSMMATMVAMLAGRLEGTSSQASEHITVEAELIVRESTTAHQ